jgi:hypothetical protein
VANLLSLIAATGTVKKKMTLTLSTCGTNQVCWQTPKNATAATTNQPSYPNYWTNRFKIPSPAIPNSPALVFTSL